MIAQLESTAKEISDFYERMMAEDEEELRCSKEENQQKQRTLNQVLSQRVLLQRMSPDINQGLPLDVLEPQVKEEPEWSEKEEEELPV